jgi:hypothetical protein
MNKLIINWSTFSLCNSPIDHNDAITKILQRIRFNSSLFIEFCTCEKTTMKKNLFHQNSQFPFKL